MELSLPPAVGGAACVLLVFRPGCAHCDALDGPVVKNDRTEYFH